MENYFENIVLLENTLLPYFCDEKSLKFINKQFYQLNYKKYLKPSQYHGVIETYYIKTKTIKERCTFENGTLSGLYESWYENGQLEEKSSYVNNKLHGSYKLWYDNGELEESGNYKYGKNVFDTYIDFAMIFIAFVVIWIFI